MPEEKTTQQEEYPFFEGYPEFPSIQWGVWGPLIGGVFLVAFSNVLGVNLVKEPGAYSWDTESARGAAVIVRSLGFMAFAAGLVERCILAISAVKAESRIDTESGAKEIAEPVNANSRRQFVRRY